MTTPATLGPLAAARSMSVVMASDSASSSAAAAAVARSVFKVLSANADAHVSGDVIADTEELPLAAPAADIEGLINSISLLRKDSTTGIDVRVWFFEANVSLGTESSAVSITDSNAEKILGYVDFAAADFVSLVGSCYAQQRNVNIPAKPASGTRSIYVAVEALGSVDLAATTDLAIRVGMI